MAKPLVATDGSGQLHGWQAAAAALVIGLVFALFGFGAVIGIRRGHRPPPPVFVEDPVRRVDVAIFDSEEDVHDLRSKGVGWTFLVLGSLLAIGGAVALVALALRGEL